MKAIRVFTLAIGLLGVLAAVAAVVKKTHVEDVHTKQQTGENQPGFAVVELFTSEGCSSCPPADELIDKIQKSNQDHVYVLAFHVDYWDHQGWKDSFGDPEFTKRQHQYAEWLDLQTLYTPQVVVNGKSEYVGSHGGPILGAIANGLEQKATTTLILEGTVEGGKVNVRYQVDGDEKNSELVLTLVQRSAQSNVRAGENSGRRLSHVQIVRRLVYVPLGGDRKKEIAMELPGDFTEKGWELIGFVQNKMDGHITAVNRFDFQSGIESRGH
ncbi:DUF1223 domain-containing protein [Chryseolinea soli]|uniref:DUF1223 domain-containing protein n=1 Tax=Chryseolinea soli TaxID=2321403 RepID=A0A385SRD2_9BACT|nr:DUF1223 domain-containing protein [Chryseolinea soli]AYB33136.1 DUF1223 domain-containing protein [Chryseolinea soli]